MSVKFGQCSQCQVKVERGKKNVGQPLESRRNSLPFKSYRHFRFGGRHFDFRLSTNIVQCPQCSEVTMGLALTVLVLSSQNHFVTTDYKQTTTDSHA